MSYADRYGPWAVVTGASDGIGRAVAHQLAGRGLHLVLVARRTETLRALARDIEAQHGVHTRIVAVDLGTSLGVAKLEESVAGVDIGLAVLAAGFGATGHLADADAVTEADMIAVNVTAVAELSRFFAARMVRRGRGGIVLFGSILGWQGVPGQANYAATKAYVQALAEGLHAELAPRGVDVLSVAPGPVHTGFAARAGMTMSSATSPEVVASAALAALGRRVTIVPGAQAKFLTWSLAFLPRVWRTRVLGRVTASMRTSTPA
ncbi:MAG: SDR family NAD(P)-dependent oxidoreductase [Mycobacterium kyogaense]